MSDLAVWFMRVGKWEGVMPIPTSFFFVDSFDLRSMSFKFGNYIFITFEISSVAYIMTFRKISISLLFRPFTSEVLST